MVSLLRRYVHRVVPVEDRFWYMMRTCQPSEREEYARYLAERGTERAVNYLIRMANGAWRGFGYGCFGLEDQELGVEYLGKSRNLSALIYIQRLDLHRRKVVADTVPAKPSFTFGSKWIPVRREVTYHPHARGPLRKALVSEIALDLATLEDREHEYYSVRERNLVVVNEERFQAFCSPPRRAIRMANERLEDDLNVPQDTRAVHVYL